MDWTRHIPKKIEDNLLWRRTLLLDAERHPAARQILISACRKSVIFFFCAFLWTRDPRRIGLPVRSPFITWDYQDEALHAIDTAFDQGSDLIFDKTRAMGASWIIVGWCLWRAAFFRDFSCLFTSRKEELVDGKEDSLFGFMKFMIANCPRWLLCKLYSKKMHMGFLANRSVIEGEATNDNIGRGGRRSVILLDEFAAHDNGGYDIDSSTQDTTNTRLINSTPGGTECAYYQLKSSGAIPVVRMHWSRHPEKNRGLYRPGPEGPILLDHFRGVVYLGTHIDPDSGQRVKTPFLFPDNYPFSSETPRGREGLRSPWYDSEVRRRKGNKLRIAQELDIDDSGAVKTFVDDDELQAYISTHCTAPLYRGHIKLAEQSQFDRASGPAKWSYHPHPDGALEVWCQLDAHHRPPLDRSYIISCDISEGLGASDSVATVIDTYTKSKVAMWSNNHTPVEQFAYLVVWGLCEMFSHAGGKPVLIWEANGPGRNFKRVVWDQLKYGNVWFRSNEQSADARKSRNPGWESFESSKNALLTRYREALFGDLEFHNPSQKAMEEVGRYKYEGASIVHPDAVRKKDGSVDHGRNHGDCVIADALGLHALGPITIPEPAFSPPVILPGSMAHRAMERGIFR